MNTVSRVRTRLFACRRTLVLAMALAGLAIALTAAPASAVKVKLRIEGSAATHFNGVVDTGPRKVADADGSCAATGTAGDVTAANAVTAVADWAQAAGSTALFQWGGTFLCAAAGDIGGATEYWLMKINNRTQNPPGNYLSGATPVVENDAVLWYFTDDFAKPTLDLRIAETVGVGQAVTGRVDVWDGADDSVEPAAGAVVSGGGANATTGADGSFTIALPTAGTHLLTATRASAVRGSAWLNAVAEPQALPTPPPAAKPIARRVNRFVRCANRYGKGSPRHRRCIRIVRRKQLRECRRTALRATAVCRKLRARSRR